MWNLLTMPLNDYAPFGWSMASQWFQVDMRWYDDVAAMVQQLLLMLLLTYERCMLDVFFYDLRPVGTPLATGNNLNCNNLQLATFVLHFAVADYCKMRQRSQSHTHLAISRLTVEKINRRGGEKKWRAEKCTNAMLSFLSPRWRSAKQLKLQSPVALPANCDRHRTASI